MRPGEPRLDVYAPSAPRRRTRKRLPQALAAMLLLGAAFVGCSGGQEWTAVHEAPSGRTYGPGEYDKDSVAVLGREALEKLGYERIMELAEQAGFVTRKPASGLAQADKSMVAMDGVAAGRVFVRVFTKRAVAAGITSQLDSPAPGPADVVAVGMLVIGLMEAGVAVYEEIQRSKPPAATTSAPPVPPAPVAATSKPTAGPVPVVTSKPTAGPVPTATSPPLPAPRNCVTEYPKLRLCSSLPEEYAYPSAGAALAEMKARLGKKGLQLHNESAARSGPCPGIGKHYNVRQGGDRAGSITCCPCCIDGSSGPQESDRCRIVW